MPFCGYLPYFSPVCMRRIILCPHKIGTTTISGFIKEKGSLETLPGATNGTAPNNIKSAGDSGNPLAPPVGNVYSNIEGGYGIFAGYNQVTLVGTSIYGN